MSKIAKKMIDKFFIIHIMFIIRNTVLKMNKKSKCEHDEQNYSYQNIIVYPSCMYTDVTVLVYTHLCNLWNQLYQLGLYDRIKQDQVSGS